MGFWRAKGFKMIIYIHTVDGSEIPFPTTWDVYKILQITGKTTNLNWWVCRISEPSTVAWVEPPPSRVVTSRIDRESHIAVMMIPPRWKVCWILFAQKKCNVQRVHSQQKVRLGWMDRSKMKKNNVLSWRLYLSCCYVFQTRAFKHVSTKKT